MLKSRLLLILALAGVAWSQSTISQSSPKRIETSRVLVSIRFGELCEIVDCDHATPASARIRSNRLFNMGLTILQTIKQAAPHGAACAKRYVLVGVERTAECLVAT